ACRAGVGGEGVGCGGGGGGGGRGGCGGPAGGCCGQAARRGEVCCPGTVGCSGQLWGLVRCCGHAGGWGRAASGEAGSGKGGSGSVGGCGWALIKASLPSDGARYRTLTVARGVTAGTGRGEATSANRTHR